MNNKCIDCIHWWSRKCDNVNSDCYGKTTYEIKICPWYEYSYEPSLFKEEPIEVKKETVNHPSHYNKGIEAIDIIESWELNFSLGNAIKYILRAPHKNNELEDLRKAKWYLERELERLAKNDK